MALNSYFQQDNYRKAFFMNFNYPHQPTPIPIEPRNSIPLPTPIPIEPSQFVPLPTPIPIESGMHSILPAIIDRQPTPIPIEPKQTQQERHEGQTKFNSWKTGKDKELKKRRFARKYEKAEGHLRSEITNLVGESKLELRLDMTFDNEAQALNALHQLSAVLANVIETKSFGVAAETETTALAPIVNNLPVVVERKPLENIAKPQIIKARDKETGFMSIVTELDSRLMSEKAKRDWGFIDDIDLDPMVETAPPQFKTDEVALVDEDIEWTAFEDDDFEKSESKYEVIN